MNVALQSEVQPTFSEMVYTLLYILLIHVNIYRGGCKYMLNSGRLSLIYEHCVSFFNIFANIVVIN